MLKKRILPFIVIFAVVAIAATTVISTQHATHAASCMLTANGRVTGGRAVTITAVTSCQGVGFDGVTNIVAKHCSLEVAGFCLNYDSTINVASCNVSTMRPSCVGSAILSSAGRWDVTSTTSVTTSDGGTGGDSTTGTFRF